MTAEIISVGTELLLGDIVNTNAAFIGRKLAELGISVYRQTVVGDNYDRLMQAYTEAFNRGTDLVIATGGLGPTEDDITKEVAAEYFNVPLYLHEETWKETQELWEKLRPGEPIVPGNKKLAMLPEGAKVLPNPNGSAPGLLLQEGKKNMLLLPGPPNELHPIFLTHVVPMLKQMSQVVLVSTTLKIVGIGESLMEEQIKHLINAQTNPTIAPYAKTAEVHLRITASASCEKEAHALITPVVDELYSIFGNAIYGTDSDTLEGVIAGLLKDRGLAVACAESCTGGMVASKLINHPGVSEVFREGIVAYSNGAKIQRLGVDEKLLNKHGAVSAEVAAAMAEGVAMAGQVVSVTNHLVGLATTGIAGPGGGTEEKPVGLVYLGLHVPGVGTKTKELNLTGDRLKVRERTTIAALDFLRREIIGK